MIYLDNAATTYPKSENVYKAIDDANRKLAVNAGRGSYKKAREVEALIEETRTLLLKTVNSTGKAILTPSATIALNIIINGLNINIGDTVYVSPYEHNAIIRTLYLIKSKTDINIVELPLDKKTLELDLKAVEYEFAKNKPSYVFISHVSNVTGYVQPVEEIFNLSKGYGAINVMDASQSFGLIDIDAGSIKADFIVFAGHKTIYGPFGAAGFIDNGSVELKLTCVGGTGSDSLNYDMPETSPGRYEAGSKDIVAIAGLNAALKELNVAEAYKQEKELTMYLIEKLKELDGVTMYIPSNYIDNHIGIVSLNVEGYKAEDIGMILDEDYDIAVRTGYHCAPLIHKYLDEKEHLGTVRISLGKFNSKEDIDALIEGLEEILDE